MPGGIHLLIGLLLMYLFPRWREYKFAVVLGSILPDIDVPVTVVIATLFTSFSSMIVYPAASSNMMPSEVEIEEILEYWHRSVTHSVFVILALFVALMLPTLIARITSTSSKELIPTADQEEEEEEEAEDENLIINMINLIFNNNTNNEANITNNNNNSSSSSNTNSTINANTCNNNNNNNASASNNGEKKPSRARRLLSMIKKPQQSGIAQQQQQQQQQLRPQQQQQQQRQRRGKRMLNSIRSSVTKRYHMWITGTSDYDLAGFALGLAVGMISHVLLDLVYLRGVRMLWPLYESEFYYPHVLARPLRFLFGEAAAGWEHWHELSPVQQKFVMPLDHAMEVLLFYCPLLVKMHWHLRGSSTTTTTSSSSSSSSSGSSNNTSTTTTTTTTTTTASLVTPQQNDGKTNANNAAALVTATSTTTTTTTATTTTSWLGFWTLLVLSVVEAIIVGVFMCLSFLTPQMDSKEFLKVFFAVGFYFYPLSIAAPFLYRDTLRHW